MNKTENLSGRFLIVDDEENIREILKATLEPLSTALFTAGSAEEALDYVKDENLDIIICDIQMPGMNGLEFLSKVKSEQPAIQFLMITAHGTMDTAIKALRYGASDFLTKPFENEEIRNISKKLLRERGKNSEPVPNLAAPAIQNAQSGNVIAGIVGRSPIFLSCLEVARKAAVSDTSVLLTGESGTGKEVLARAIHNLSNRSEKPFIAVNCGAIPENLIESELFGHEKGSFTGAIAAKPGKFTLADGGTIFLDEIGEMPMLMQVKLLRVLQERIVEPVGSTRGQKVDFRLIAATHRNLKEAITQNKFREDLFYRLSIIPIELPPLRNRTGDVLLLAKNFLAYYNERYGNQYQFSSEHEKILNQYPWPGNVRELANAVERAVVLASDGKLVFNLTVNSVVSSDSANLKTAVGIKDKKQAVEREEILKALEANRWNKTQTAEALGMSRRSLLYKIKEYAII